MKKILTFCIALAACAVFVCACQNNKLTREPQYDNYEEMGKAYSVEFSFIGEYTVNSNAYASELGKIYSLPTSKSIDELNQNITSEKIDTQGNIEYYIPNNDLKGKIILSEGVFSDEEEKENTIFLYCVNMKYLITGDDVEYLWF